MESSGWVIVVFENEHAPAGEVAYVKGPFEKYEDATDWAENNAESPGRSGCGGEWQITFLDPATDAEKAAA